MDLAPAKLLLLSIFDWFEGKDKGAGRGGRGRCVVGRDGGRERRQQTRERLFEKVNGWRGTTRVGREENVGR